MAGSSTLVKQLREKTGAGILDCQKALRETDDDMGKAVDYLRQKGLAAAEKKAGRQTNQGVIGTYVHAGSRIGVMIEVNCETDFVARNEEFQSLVKDLCLQVAASRPSFVKREEVPASCRISMADWTRVATPLRSRALWRARALSTVANIPM